MIMSDFVEYNRYNGDKLLIDTKQISAVEDIVTDDDEHVTAIHIGPKSFWVKESYKSVKEHLILSTAKCICADEDDLK